MVPGLSSRPSTSCFPGCAISSPTALTLAPTCAPPSLNSATGPSRSSNAPPTRLDFNCSHGDGSSNEPLLGSIETAAWQRTSRLRSRALRPGFTSPPCSYSLGDWLRNNTTYEIKIRTLSAQVCCPAREAGELAAGVTTRRGAPMVTITSPKRHALEWIDEQTRRFSDFHQRIWNYAEPAWREYKSAKSYCDLLRAEGFAVEEGSGEMPTAFAARWGKSGPVLGTYAEYDAVPGNSQQAVPYHAPRAGLHPWAAGHTDPHSALGTTALAGVLAAKAAMERFGLPGTLLLFGEPAEKVCGSKPVHAAKGYYDGADAFISYHPHFANTAI